MGVPIGKDNFVQRWLQEKLVSLGEMGNKLIHDFTGSKQEKLMLLRYSFAQKVNYLLRTIPPKLTKEFAQQFDSLKISLFCQLLEVKQEVLSSMQKLQVLTHIRDGGFGLFQAEQSAAAAYMASVKASWDILVDVCPDLLSSLDLDWFKSKGKVPAEQLFNDWYALDKVQLLRNSATWVAQFVDAIKSVGEAGISKPSLYKFFMGGGSGRQLQKILYLPIRRRHIVTMKEGWPSEFHRSRFLDCIGYKGEPSAWLEATPSNRQLRFLDDDFRIMCVIRLGLQVPEIIAALRDRPTRFNNRCSLCISSNRPPQCKVIDAYGHHFAHGCLFNRGKLNTHNSVVSVLAEMHRLEGKSVATEVTLAPLSQENVGFVSNNNNNVAASTVGISAEDDDELRADLIVRGPTMKVIEVTITDPCSSLLHDHRDPDNDSQAQPMVEYRESSKVAKYKKDGVIVEGDSRRSLQVFAFSIFGRINKSAYDYIRKMSKQNCRTGYAAVYFREYWFQRLSCALQRNLAAFYKFNFALFCGEIRYDFERNRSLANWKYRDVNYIKSGVDLCSS